MAALSSFGAICMQYRLYQPGDFTQLYAIEEACFQPPLRFPRSHMRKLVNSSNGVTWVVEQEGALAGFAIVEWFADGNVTIAYIETIEIAAAWRKQGIGSELLRRIEGSASAAGAQSIWLHVDAANESAIHLYETHGYEYQRREEHYYERQRPALIYAKQLSELATES